MSSRDFILDRVRRNQPAPLPLPEVPLFAPSVPARWEHFSAALERMGGTAVELRAPQSVDDWLRTAFPKAGVVVSATPELRGTRSIETARAAPGSLEDVDVGVVRAAFGVAETGSVWLSEREFVVNALGFLPQHLVVLLDPQALLPGLQQAYLQRGFFEARYAVLMTGPSATADIEGVLIRGAQGVRSFTVVARAAP